MRIAIVSRTYPTVQEQYKYAFVHRRAKKYTEKHEVRVFVPSARIDVDYEFEGVSVAVRSKTGLGQSVEDYSPDIVFTHAPTSRGTAIHFDVIDQLISLYKRTSIPVVTFLHGAEALIKSRYYPSPSLKYLLHRGPRQAHQLYKIRKHVKYFDQQGCPTVFVSNWLKEAVEDSIFYTIDNYEIIPNPIDNDVFTYCPRDLDNVFDILSIRPMRPKYANDLTIEAISKLERGHLNLYGKGPLLEEMQELAEELDANVTFHPKFLTQQEMADRHREHGIYLSPTRTDAQGVSMCEAMASGMPVITTRTQAIPEFMIDGETGYLCDGPEMMADRIRHLQQNPEKMVDMGRQASKFILDKCGAREVVKKDILTAQTLL